MRWMWILLFGFVLAFGGCTSVPAKRKFERRPVSETVKSELIKTKGVRLDITVSGVVPQTLKPRVETLTQALLKASKISEGGDAVLFALIDATPIWGSYTRGSHASGAVVWGRVGMRSPSGPGKYEIEFRTVRQPPYMISKSYPTGYDAPYDELIVSADSYMEKLCVLIHEIWGPAPLIAAAQSGDFRVNGFAHMVLGDFGTAEAFKMLEAGATGDQADQRRMAYAGLGRFPDERAVRLLNSLYTAARGRDDLILLSAALGEQADPVSAPLLLAEFRKTGDTVPSAAEALYRITGIRADIWGDKAGSIKKYERWIEDWKARQAQAATQKKS